MKSKSKCYNNIPRNHVPTQTSIKWPSFWNSNLLESNCLVFHQNAVEVPGHMTVWSPCSFTIQVAPSLFAQMDFFIRRSNSRTQSSSGSSFTLKTTASTFHICLMRPITRFIWHSIPDTNPLNKTWIQSNNYQNHDLVIVITVRLGFIWLTWQSKSHLFRYIQKFLLRTFFRNK